MKNGLYRIEVRTQVEELENGGHVVILGVGGTAFAEIHPIKIKGTPKKEKPITGLDGTVYTQDEDKQGWTGHTSLKVEPLDAVTVVKAMCLAWHGCLNCPLLEWCRELPPDGKPMDWYIPVEEG